jgi:Bacteriophage T4-like portal protein (Gp20)
MAQQGFQLFGWQISRTADEDTVESQAPAIAPPQTDDGAYVINAGSLGGYYGTYLNLESAFKNENELISRYRTMAMQPEVEAAIDEIVNEAIVHDKKGMSVEIILDELQQTESIKQMLREEFKSLLRMLDFDNNGHDIFRRWYIDGRLFYQVQIDETNPRNGIIGLVYLDPRKTRKIRTVIKDKDPRTGVEFVKGYADFYVYNDKSMTAGNMVMSSPVDASMKIAEDAVVNINSGLMDVSRNMVLSYLHKAIKPLNSLRMIEDAVVIYRLSRAPERRVFYIDVGNLPKMKADQYMNDIMTKFRNKIVYDASTGEVKDDRKFTSMIEDFWIPRRGEGKSTEITTLPAGQNLGQLDDVKYFEEKLYKSLGVPISRLVPQQGFSLGRSNEITREELKFNKFVERLRAKFTLLFDELMKRQLALKGIASYAEWDQIKEFVYYDFLEDNNFSELKDAELLNNRIQTLNVVTPYVGLYYSMEWVRKNVLHLSEEEIEEMALQIEEEQEQQMAIAAAEAAKQQVMASTQVPVPGMSGGGGGAPPGGMPR